MSQNLYIFVYYNIDNCFIYALKLFMNRAQELERIAFKKDFESSINLIILKLKYLSVIQNNQSLNYQSMIDFLKSSKDLIFEDIMSAKGSNRLALLWAFRFLGTC